MSLKHALLGFLNYGPMTGYELKKFFDTSVNHFWSAELSQIYPTLKQLESEGLVEMRLDVQEDRPNRKVYHITDDGRRELLEWLAQPAEPEQVREPLLIKVFFGASLPKQELSGVLRHRAEQLQRGIESYERGCSIIQKFAEAIGLQHEAYFWTLTLEAGIKSCQAGIEWAEEVIDKIVQLEESIPAAHRPQARPVDARTAMEILEKLRAAMPEGFAGVRGTAGSKTD